MRLLLGAQEFWAALDADLAGATDVHVHLLTFEADAAGLPLADRLATVPGECVLVVDDMFTRHKINDRLLWTTRDPVVHNEAAATQAMLDRLRESITVHVAGPVGPMGSKLLRRSHKKIVVVDERVVYLGGINFSDHNFGWHDLMVRIEDPTLAKLLANDVRATAAGEPRVLDETTPSGRVLGVTGHDNALVLDAVLERIRTARRIQVHTPYAGPPFTDALRQAAEAGADVTLLTAGENNWSIFQRGLTWFGQRHGMDVRWVPGMSHLKAMLLDDETIIFGSTNFDSMSYWSNEEIVLMSDDPDLVSQFRDHVFAPDLAASRPAQLKGGRGGYAALRAIAALARLQS